MPRYRLHLLDQSGTIEDYRLGDRLIAVPEDAPDMSAEGLSGDEMFDYLREWIAAHGFCGTLAGRTDEAIRIRNAAGVVREFKLTEILSQVRDLRPGW